VRATKFTLISEDLSLIAMCREALRDLGQAGAWELTVSADGEADPATGICLWDYQPGRAAPPASAGSRHWFLVSRKDLDEFHNAAPFAEGSILLKPLTRAVLNAFLGSAAQVSTSRTLRDERDELLGSLFEANLKLQEYDQQRTNFLARAVHEFRVPLTALSGFCGLFSAGELGSLTVNQQDALRRMEHSIARMSRMTTAMFELSIAGQSDQQPRLQEGHIAECIDRALNLMQPLASEKDLLCAVAELVPPQMPMLFESEQIEQVLVNLLDNACKASPRHGSIEIFGYPYFWERRFLAGASSQTERRLSDVPAPNSYRVDVRDAGPGVRPEHLESIFEEYTSYFGSQDRSGGGLGLAICRLIVQRHHGRIWASAEPSGACFSFVLPYATAKPVRQALPLIQKSQTA
jgi:signal transduction histidine kinase